MPQKRFRKCSDPENHYPTLTKHLEDTQSCLDPGPKSRMGFRIFDLLNRYFKIVWARLQCPSQSLGSFQATPAGPYLLYCLLMRDRWLKARPNFFLPTWHHSWKDSSLSTPGNRHKSRICSLYRASANRPFLAVQMQESHRCTQCWVQLFPPSSPPGISRWLFWEIISLP